MNQVKESLFNEDERYSTLASVIDSEMRCALSPIFEKYKGICKVRELQYLADAVSLELALDIIIDGPKLEAKNKE